ncbi:MAG: PhoU domain-containing protein [Candidatus Hermodarchaeota archaeon]|nr:PhoU domain-containing protein [Candidatus Hermodarchaeota archaeon]
MSTETRKVQLTGGATYIISLPKQWAKKAGLKPGSELQLVPQDRHSLLLYTAASPEASTLSESQVEISEGLPTEDVVRNFITQYLAGFDIIQLDLQHINADQRVTIKDTIRRLMIGAEIISETTDKIVVQCFLGQANLPLLNALERMEALVRSMQHDAVIALLEGDKQLAEEVVQRDPEVDRFYFYIVRQLAAAVGRTDRIRQIGLSSPQACLGYRLVVKSIERAGDHATRLASIAASTKLPEGSPLGNTFMKMHRISDKVFQDSLTTLRNLDVPLAHETIRRVESVVQQEDKGIRALLGGKFPVEAVLNLRLGLESLRRIAEYGSDIAETSIDLSVEK